MKLVCQQVTKSLLGEHLDVSWCTFVISAACMYVRCRNSQDSEHLSKSHYGLRNISPCFCILYQLATGHMVMGWSLSPSRSKISLPSMSSGPVMGPHVASYSVDTGGPFSGGKAAEKWSWPTPPASPKVKSMWMYVYTPPYVFLALSLTS